MEIILGLILCVTLLWTLIIGIQHEQWLWVIGMFFFYPIFYVYGLLNLDKAKSPFLISTVTLVLAVMFIDPASLEQYR